MAVAGGRECVCVKHVCALWQMARWFAVAGALVPPGKGGESNGDTEHRGRGLSLKCGDNGRQALHKAHSPVVKCGVGSQRAGDTVRVRHIHGLLPPCYLHDLYVPGVPHRKAGCPTCRAAKDPCHESTSTPTGDFERLYPVAAGMREEKRCWEGRASRRFATA